MEMTQEETKVWREIEGHKGRANAVKTATIAENTGIDKKRVQAVVAYLVNRHKKLIASSCQPPTGYYVIADPVELKKEIDSLTSRGTKEFARASRLMGASGVLFGQMELYHAE